MKRSAVIPLLLLFWLALPVGAAETLVPVPAVGPLIPPTQVARVFLSEHLINQLLKQYVNTPYVQDLTIDLDPTHGLIMAHGLLKIPPDDLKAVNLEPGMGNFRFQFTIQPKTTRHGHLILIFPFNETYLIPASSTDPKTDRIVIPFELMSLGLASARGYLAILSGDFSSFDHKTAQLQQQIASLDRQIAAAPDADTRDSLQTNRQSLQNQLEAIPLQRKEAEQLSKKTQAVFGFVGGKEINLNQELAVHRNAIILRLRLSQLLPYLDGIELGGLKILTDDRDGSGEHFISVDVNAPIHGYDVTETSAPAHANNAARQKRLPPEIVIRLNQALLESQAVLDSEKDDLDKHIRNFTINLEADGVHARGAWHLLLVPDIPFDAIVDLTWVSPNTFDIRVREIKVLGVDLRLLTGLVLEAAKKRLDGALKGVCTFQYIGEEKDSSRAIRVTTNMAALVPAFPKMALTGIRIKEKEFILLAGEPQEK